jgi:predicted Zn-dependent peptidase
MSPMTITSGARRSAALVAALVVAPIAAVPAQQKEPPPAPAAPKQFTLPPRHEFTLPNGMGVTFVQYGVTPKVDLALVLRVGAVNERPDQVWLSRLMGDLMQQGTTTRSAEQIARLAADMGGSLDVSVGADQTQIGGSVLAEFAPSMAELIADVAMHPTFPDSELPRLKADRERERAIAMTQPQAIAFATFRSVLYPSHPYGRVYPTAEMLAGYSVQQIRSFYDTNVGAVRAHLYVVGRFDEAATERAVRQAFESWKRGTPNVPDVPNPTSRRTVHLVDRPGAVQSSLYLGLPVPPPINPDWVALDVTNALLGGSFNSRITADIREQKGYTYSPYSTVSSRYRDAYWAEVADVTTNVTGPSLDAIFKQIDSLRRVPPSREELEGIQKYLAGTFVLRNSSRAGIISQLAFVRLHGLGDDYLTSYVKRVYAVTPDEVKRIAEQYLDPSKMAIVVVGDRKVVRGQVIGFGRIVE